jgi:hypothetical protein
MSRAAYARTPNAHTTKPIRPQPPTLNITTPITESSSASSAAIGSHHATRRTSHPTSNSRCVLTEACPASAEASATPAAPKQGPSTGVAHEMRRQ